MVQRLLQVRCSAMGGIDGLDLPGATEVLLIALQHVEVKAKAAAGALLEGVPERPGMPYGWL
jgi:hypothetical protein